ncbi:hypothetical protein E4U30_002001 [Claviceps sp. LM220 group G6]|nr:hypothetical protein E4U30_002001 [Claviceps sp. LM220 group G6]
MWIFTAKRPGRVGLLPSKAQGAVFESHTVILEPLLGLLTEAAAGASIAGEPRGTSDGGQEDRRAYAENVGLSMAMGETQVRLMATSLRKRQYSFGDFVGRI